MVFCCIAIVGIAMIYWVCLSVRQLVIGTPRDKSCPLPAPPRGITGNGAQPVFGHTWLFRRKGGDLALRFPHHWHEWKWLPKGWSRELGDCFSLFIWGQWRIAVRGPDRVQQLMDLGDLEEDFAWSPPVALLGHKCLPLLEKDAADFLYNILSKPLAHNNVVKLAPEFAGIAQQFMNQLASGQFNNKKTNQQKGGLDEPVPPSISDIRSFSFSDDEFPDEDIFRAEEGLVSGSDESMDSGMDMFKLKFNALRSYTFDLMDGPVLQTNRWNQVETEQTIGESSSHDDRALLDHDEDVAPPNGGGKHVSRSTMMLWMERIKRAMCVIKMTFGPEWMYIWICNEYGRAVNGRIHIEEVISNHVENLADALPIERKAGHVFHDPFATHFPILTMAENYWNAQETATGNPVPLGAARQRTRSEPNMDQSGHGLDLGMDLSIDSPENEELFPEYDKADSLPKPQTISRSQTAASSCPPTPAPGTPTRNRANSCPEVLVSPDLDKIIYVVETPPEPVLEKIKEESPKKKPVGSVLDSLLRRVDHNGTGMTCAAITDLSILLWMMMDAGSAWTAMALNLLALDEGACIRVQQEIDELIGVHGQENLFTPMVMAEMKLLDALLYEAVRLCPPFMGGLKRTTNTVVLDDLGLQIPKNSHIFFCQPTEEPFNLYRAIGKKPEDLGKNAPSPTLHGFLPLKGLEVPLMVLQSKVFIAVLLQRFSPYLSKKRTFIRKIKAALVKAKLVDEILEKEEERRPSISSLRAEESTAHIVDSGQEGSKKCGDTTRLAAMKLFDKIPFPEPRRVLHIRERTSALDLLGVAKLGNAV